MTAGFFAGNAFIYSAQKMPTIAIDARFWGPKSRGLGRYTTQLVSHLEKIDQRNHYQIFLKKADFSRYRPRNPRFSKHLADVPWYSVKEQLVMPRLLHRTRPDLVHFPHFNVPWLYQGPFVVTIHDLILKAFPTQKATRLGPIAYKIKKLGYHQVLKKTLRQSQKIIAVSNFTRQDLIKHFPAAASKTSVIYEACEKPLNQLELSENQPIASDRQLLEKYGLHSPYILYIGAAYPHKNLENLLLAFKDMKTNQSKKIPRSLTLVLAGGHDYFYRKIQQFVRKQSIPGVKFLGLIPDETRLRMFYRNARAFVFPSFYEGFGLPPLEAMATGTPVVSANTGSLPEILGDAAHYFNPHQPRAIAQKIIEVLTDDDLAQKLITKGAARIQRFSWEKTAQQTLTVYEEVLAKINKE